MGGHPQISQKLNLVHLSSNFQGRSGQMNKKGWWQKIYNLLSQNLIFKQKWGTPRNQPKIQPCPIDLKFLG